MLITFEGIDGCGKTTQLRWLREFLESLGRKVRTLREPGGSELSERIRDILLFTKENVAPRAELLLFEAARAQLVETLILPALAAGEIVLCDRFYDSTTAYQGYGRGLPLDEIAECNKIATQSLKPDLTFFLDLSLEESKNRSHNRHQDRIEQAGDEFFEKVLAGFHKIAEQSPERFHIIDASGTSRETSAKIIEIVKAKL